MRPVFARRHTLSSTSSSSAFVKSQLYILLRRYPFLFLHNASTAPHSLASLRLRFVSCRVRYWPTMYYYPCTIFSSQTLLHLLHVVCPPDSPLYASADTSPPLSFTSSTTYLFVIWPYSSLTLAATFVYYLLILVSLAWFPVSPTFIFLARRRHIASRRLNQSSSTHNLHRSCAKFTVVITAP